MQRSLKKLFEKPIKFKFIHFKPFNDHEAEESIIISSQIHLDEFLKERGYLSPFESKAA
jgi:hypothetical protein